MRSFQEFATIDLISKDRAQIVAGRGSFGEAYPLFGSSFDDHDALLAERLDLLLRRRDETTITWAGRLRPALNVQEVYPRPVQAKLPIWLGVGGTPQSCVHADTNAAARDAFFPGWAHMFTEIGRARGRSRVTRAQFDAMCGPDGAFLIGDPDTVRAKMLAADQALLIDNSGTLH